MPMIVKKILIDGFNPNTEQSGFAIARQIKHFFGDTIEIHALQNKTSPDMLACPWIDFAHCLKTDDIEELMALHQRHPFHAIWLQHSNRALCLSQHQSTLEQAGVKILTPSMDQVNKVLFLRGLPEDIAIWPHITLFPQEPYWSQKLKELLPLCSWPLQIHQSKDYFFSLPTLIKQIKQNFQTHRSAVRVGPCLENQLISAVALNDHHGNVVDIQIKQNLSYNGTEQAILTNQPDIKALCLMLLGHLQWKGLLHFQFYKHKEQFYLYNLQTELPAWMALNENPEGLVPHTVRCLLQLDRHAPIPQNSSTIRTLYQKNVAVDHASYEAYHNFGESIVRPVTPKNPLSPKASLLNFSYPQHPSWHDLTPNFANLNGIQTLKRSLAGNTTTQNQPQLTQALLSHFKDHESKLVLGFDDASLSWLQCHQKTLQEQKIWSRVPSTWSLEKAEQLFCCDQSSNFQRIRWYKAQSLRQALDVGEKLGYPLELGMKQDHWQWNRVDNPSQLEHQWHNFAFFPCENDVQLRSLKHGDRFEAVAFFDDQHRLYHATLTKMIDHKSKIVIEAAPLISNIQTLGKQLRWQGILHSQWIRDHLTDQWILTSLSPYLPSWHLALQSSDFDWIKELTRSSTSTLTPLPSSAIGKIITHYPSLQHECALTPVELIFLPKEPA